jgi:hypothetical protein
MPADPRQRGKTVIGFVTVFRGDSAQIGHRRFSFRQQHVQAWISLSASGLVRRLKTVAETSAVETGDRCGW